MNAAAAPPFRTPARAFCPPDLFSISPNRIDWFRVVVDLERSGLTQAEIGDAVEISKTQVNAYKSLWAEPRFHVGLLMLGLWADRTKQTTLPTRSL